MRVVEVERSELCKSLMPTIHQDRPCMDEVSKYMPPGESHTGVPAFDHIHFHFSREGRSDREPPLPQGETFIFKAKES
jgi:hypothetical protein